MRGDVYYPSKTAADTPLTDETMANPNRVGFYTAKNPSQFWLFNKPGQAEEFACYVRALGFKVRESSLRVGPRTGNAVNYRVSVYWTAGNAPDLKYLDERARACGW